MLLSNEATRKLDKLGRIKIPSEFVKKMQMEKGVRCEITIEYGVICIRKFNEQNINKNPYTGMVRRLDDLDRISIPTEYLTILKIPKDVTLNLLLVKDKITIFLAE